MNSHHPDPRRVWKGGAEQQSMTPHPVDPRDPGMNNEMRYHGSHSEQGGSRLWPQKDHIFEVVYGTICF